jgi:hypothetical protein
MSSCVVDRLDLPVAAWIRTSRSSIVVPLGAFEIETLALAPETPTGGGSSDCR